MSRLAREGSVVVRDRIAPNSPMWRDCDLPWSASVTLEATAGVAGTGQIVVRGRMTGTLGQECRRCLKPTETEIANELTMVFVTSDDPCASEYGVHSYEAGKELDLSEAIREEAVLAFDPYVLCTEDCRGLCTNCGANMNLERCSCAADPAHPAWNNLKAQLENTHGGT
ncbi:MAG: DUF177 domain-containing protein [Gemmatimonadetes bacterium]|nr:DUF177 domain-containing protein [Gemmatimonadota bacterium]